MDILLGSRQSTLEKTAELLDEDYGSYDRDEKEASQVAERSQSDLIVDTDPLVVPSAPPGMTCRLGGQSAFGRRFLHGPAASGNSRKTHQHAEAPRNPPSSDMFKLTNAADLILASSMDPITAAAMVEKRNQSIKKKHAA